MSVCRRAAIYCVVILCLLLPPLLQAVALSYLAYMVTFILLALVYPAALAAIGKATGRRLP